MSEVNADNIFEKIISGEVPSYKIYEDDNVFAFLDINPISIGHTLVIPKIKSRNMLDVSEDVFSKVMEAVRVLAPKIKEAVEADGINIHINNEESAGQKVFHLHAHIIPQYDGKIIKFMRDPVQLEPERFKEIETKIKSHI